MEDSNQSNISSTNQPSANNSLQESNALVPEEIKHWNWGAFFLNFIWGLFHHVWLSLLVFIPYAGFIMIIILGIKGSEWAWQAQHYDSIEEFKKRERKWAIAGFILYGILIIILLVRYFLIQPIMMRGEGLKPYLNNNDYCLVEKFNKSIKKGDIVMTRTRNNLIVSLVIGLPGDKIELKDGTFFVNGEPLKGVSYNLYRAYGMDYNNGNDFIVVPPDSFFGMSTYVRKFADNEQKTQEYQTTSNNVCPPNSHLDPKDNLCYCDEGLIWNKKEGKDMKCVVNGVDLSWWLYKQSDILGKVIYPIHVKVNK